MTTLIEGGTVVTLGNSNSVIYPGGVVVEGDTIKDVGSLEDLRIKYANADVLDAKGKVIMPSFVNIHHHLYSTFARGMNLGLRISRKYWKNYGGNSIVRCFRRPYIILH